MIARELQKRIEERLWQGKAIIVTGARQVGKSTLMRQISSGIDHKQLMLNCDRPEVKAALTDTSTANLKRLVGDNKLIVIDEAQQVPDIGMTLKRIIDDYPDVQLLVTGSSSFDLQDKLAEPLTGRKYEMHLYPLSTAEIYHAKGLVETRETLQQRLIFGSYPYIVEHPTDAETDILELSGSYLYKDLLKTDDIRRPVLLDKLLKALAFQVGSLVSYNEIAKLIGTDNKTVEKYIDLLEKCYVVFRLSGLRRNLRNELKKAKKVYFYDNGIRNAVIQNFAPLSARQDAGALWENFIVGERMKYNQYHGNHCFAYFWRTAQQQEIDYVEERNGVFAPTEFKWNPKKAGATLPNAFKTAYGADELKVVTPENYLDWLSV